MTMEPGDICKRCKHYGGIGRERVRVCAYCALLPAIKNRFEPMPEPEPKPDYKPEAGCKANHSFYGAGKVLFVYLDQAWFLLEDPKEAVSVFCASLKVTSQATPEAGDFVEHKYSHERGIIYGRKLHGYGISSLTEAETMWERESFTIICKGKGGE